MQLALMLAVLAALTIAENSPAEPVAGAAMRVVLAVCGMSLVPLFAVIATGITSQQLRNEFHRRREWVGRFDRFRRLHVVLWLAVVGVILAGLGWVQLVRENWHLDGVFLADDLLILAPVALPLVASWAAFYNVDRLLQCGVPLSPADDARPLATRAGYVGLHVRHHLGLLLVPVLVLLAIDDAARLAAPRWHAHYGSWAVLAAALAGVMLLFPRLLCCLWTTSPLEDGALRRRLTAAARRWGFQARDILIWQTGGLVANAAVAGFLPRLRYVFLTDVLSAQLSEEEIEAVFAHEVAHVRRHHLLLRALAVMLPVVLWMAARRLWTGPVSDPALWLGRGGGELAVATGGLVVAAAAAYAWLVFGPYARRLEQQADLFADGATPTSAGGADPRAASALCAALEKLAVLSGTGRSRGTWLHPSVAARCEFMLRAARQPRCAARFEWWMRITAVLLVAVNVAALAVAAWPA